MPSALAFAAVSSLASGIWKRFQMPAKNVCDKPTQFDGASSRPPAGLGLDWPEHGGILDRIGAGGAHHIVGKFKPLVLGEIHAAGDTRETIASSATSRPSDGRNVRMDLRWGGNDINRIGALAQELVGLQPDITVTNATSATVTLQRETRTIPIVFVNLSDPVGSGIVSRLDRPGGNATGFANYEATLGGKWLQLLSEIAPGLKRAAIMFNPDIFSISTFMPSFQTCSPLFETRGASHGVPTGVQCREPGMTPRSGGFSQL
jgi:ABC transporter substrate binding protein